MLMHHIEPLPLHIVCTIPPILTCIYVYSTQIISSLLLVQSFIYHISSHIAVHRRYITYQSKQPCKYSYLRLFHHPLYEDYYKLIFPTRRITYPSIHDIELRIPFTITSLNWSFHSYSMCTWYYSMVGHAIRRFFTIHYNSYDPFNGHMLHGCIMQQSRPMPTKEYFTFTC